MVRSLNRRYRLPAAALLLCVVVLVGCNPIKPLRNDRLNTSLEASVDTYRKLMRWGYYDRAAQYFRAQDETVSNTDIQRLGHYRVTTYDVLNQLMADTGADARVTAHIDFYDVDTGVVKSYLDEQYWWYEAEEKRWYLGSPMPNFSLEDNP